MSNRRYTLLFLLFVAAAVAAALVLPDQFPNRISPELGYIIGGFVFVLGGLLVLQRRQRATIRQCADIIGQLNDALGGVIADQRQIEHVMQSMHSALVALEAEPQRGVGEVVAEVKVLQTLIEQLYLARGTTIAAAAAPNLRLVESQAVAAPHPRRESPAIVTATSGAAKGGDSKDEATGSLPMPPVVQGLGERQILDLLRDGLRENRVDLALQPIVSLPQRKRRFFECYSRIKSADGRVLVPEQYLDIAERHGLVTAIDNMLLFRCIQLLRRLRKANANVGFFLNISQRTLADRDFFREFINLMAQNAELAPAIVFEFSQRTMNGADGSLLRDLDRLAQLGYRFSLDKVTDLAIDISALSSRHFRFIKVEATRLAQAAASGAIGDDPRDFKRMLDSYAIDLIVDRIESEAMLLELLELHIDFGQGYLFGEPRIAKPDLPGTPA
ncbi:MAG TPA: EAL domain-containing protein [Dongiaceae bacterium]|jgi:cyclic-di-GMP phosphodiesterase TipF (flagellum assembly factor)